MNKLELDFIETLIDNTKFGLMEWGYLDEYPQLTEKIQFDIPNDFRDDCFYFDNQNSYFILTHYYHYHDPYDPEDNSDEYMLYIVPDTFRNIKHISSLDDNETCTLLIRLDNVIKNTFPNPEDIMAAFLHKKK